MPLVALLRRQGVECLGRLYLQGIKKGVPACLKLSYVLLVTPYDLKLVLDGLAGDVEPIADLGIGQSCADELQDLRLPGAQWAPDHTTGWRLLRRGLRRGGSARG